MSFRLRARFPELTEGISDGDGLGEGVTDGWGN
jgi:hypothetical protein